MKIKHFVEEMTKSIEKVEASVSNMEILKSTDKAEKQQIVQAIMELSERIKLIEAHMESRHM